MARHEVDRSWALLGLSACSSVQYVPRPALFTYSKTDQAALVAEIEGDPKPKTMRWIGDYIGLRDQVRVCQR
ncbi:hypothetical protein [Asaia bogorensis]|uniref:Uncharacterized protein n=1 Tax=Asaia bogorensis NBRC 16594 TaxID=1231624 RepID=A0AAN4R3V9_9PROT|nr:hypothetical protein [Asaia bogorensis]BAT19779.1 hypothetical protein Asbog_01506 [Asaia bogorensis NBRC 16594]GBQ77737.1 hypothetical protein AA0311_1533 [Asaia bogorensis NBRC 16594]GEL54384.1 hypothetical protein ABO01nite_23910 [Asaia bogorensis NBRC 16594]